MRDLFDEKGLPTGAASTAITMIGFGIRLGIGLIAVFALMLLRYRPRMAQTLLMITIAVVCGAAAWLLTTLALLHGTLPTDFWTKRQPGGLEGFFVGASTGVFLFYLACAEPALRALRTRSKWRKFYVQLAFGVLGAAIAVSLTVVGIVVGMLMVLEFQR